MKVIRNAKVKRLDVIRTRREIVSEDEIDEEYLLRNYIGFYANGLKVNIIGEFDESLLKCMLKDGIVSDNLYPYVRENIRVKTILDDSYRELCYDMLNRNYYTKDNEEYNYFNVRDVHMIIYEMLDELVALIEEVND